MKEKVRLSIMNEKVRKAITWIMLLIMILGIVGSIIAYVI